MSILQTTRVEVLVENVPQPVQITRFPDGQIEANWTFNGKTVEGIRARIQSFDDFQILIAVVTLVRRDCVELDIPFKNILYLNYCMGMRGDRPFDTRLSYFRDVIAPIINMLDFSVVYVLDPHSIGTTSALKNSVKVIPNAIHMTIAKVNPTVILFPDEGSKKRYERLFMGSLEVVWCSKDRTTKEFVINGEIKPWDKVLVIDDLCDGGWTFIELSKRIPVEDKHLYVTHGLFSKGINVLLAVYQTVHTTNSIDRDVEHENLYIYSV